MLVYMHAQGPKEATPKVSSQSNLVFAPKHLGDTKTYHMLLCHFCDDQWYPLNPLALWSALMVVLVEMEFSSSKYEPNKLTHTHTLTTTHIHIFSYVYMYCWALSTFLTCFFYYMVFHLGMCAILKLHNLKIYKEEKCHFLLFLHK